MCALIGKSQAVGTLRAQVDRLLCRLPGCRRPPAVLLQGETGTGKGLVAHALHGSGPRARYPFVDVNCAAIPESMIEAELFGFDKGAFTDARQAKSGLFEAAHTGVIFLDEVGLLPWGAQAKLLKVIDERVVRRLGATQSLFVDPWIIAASNENLAVAVREGRFRDDLYYRVSGVTIELPPLRERGDDILLLAEHFLARACADYGLPPRSLSADAAAALLAYPWPGNIRELMNVMDRVALLSDAHEVTAPMLGLPSAPTTKAVPPWSEGAPAGIETAEGFERAQLIEALNATRWNISFAADLLGMPRNTLRYRMARHGLRPRGSAPRRRKAPQIAGRAVTGGDAKVHPLRSERPDNALLRAVRVGASKSAPAWSSRRLGLPGDKVRSLAGQVEELT